LSPFECCCGNSILPETCYHVFSHGFFNLQNLLDLIKESIKELKNYAKKLTLDEDDFNQN